MSVANNVNIAKVCVSLTIKAIARGLEKDLNYPRKLYIAYQVVNDINTDDSTDADLPAGSNYLYSLCGGYAFEAQDILNLGGGGIVATSAGNTGLTPYPISRIITAGEAGLMTLTDSNWIGLEDINQVVINQSVYQYGVGFTFNSLIGRFDFTLSSYTLQEGDVLTSFGFMPVV